ncbi:UDP binding domain-containing protein [Candidatus Bathycorpusculum sp.]|jgi:nucleotide sugar dehydrogenase|uniref:UDP binding domain-containing protein n=1 Tax=Candidatus Bathycorpusculum sp. TaxID=2994959 RepID=UPI00281D9D80|nr:3-hydroxyacyl-CoA dehydrogenase NAD-binding domain-containing protein [Candidatus Termitimicrobium sp.]MCL2431289.1 3-hydroxyacyl-CoA dehydrogenase NAD-binding domain-containing protein [Candidatus Termitimicrobium sp.]
MPKVLHLTPQEIDTQAKRSKYTVAIVGCGHKGILYANMFADAGFNVVCTDADASVVKKAAKGKIASTLPETETKLKRHINQENINVTSELKKAISQSDIVVIALTAKTDEQKKNNYTELVNICKHIGTVLHGGTLVVYGGIAGVGFIEGTVKELLENTSGLKAGQDFGLVYSPLIAPNAPPADLVLTVAASDEFSLEAASIVLKTLTGNVKEITDLKTAEIAALFTIAKQDALSALTNEFAVFCENANADYFKVLDALNLNIPCFRPTIAGEENCDGAYLLLEDAENLNIKLRLPALARQINEEMVKHAVNLTQEALRSCGKTLRRGRVAVLGSSPARDRFVELIEQKGAKVSIYDPSAKKEAQESDNIKTSLNKTVEGADCIIVLGGQEPLSRLNLKKLKSLMKSPSVVDLAGKFDANHVAIEGFLYFGLGKGNDQK